MSDDTNQPTATPPTPPPPEPEPTTAKPDKRRKKKTGKENDGQGKNTAGTESQGTGNNGVEPLRVRVPGLTDDQWQEFLARLRVGELHGEIMAAMTITWADVQACRERRGVAGKGELPAAEAAWKEARQRIRLTIAEQRATGLHVSRRVTRKDGNGNVLTVDEVQTTSDDLLKQGLEAGDPANYGRNRLPPGSTINQTQINVTVQADAREVLGEIAARTEGLLPGDRSAGRMVNGYAKDTSDAEPAETQGADQ